MSYDYDRTASEKVARGPSVERKLQEGLETWLYNVEYLAKGYSSQDARVKFDGQSEVTCWMSDITEEEARENGDIMFGRGRYRVEAHRLKPGMWILKGQVDVAGVLKRIQVPR